MRISVVTTLYESASFIPEFFKRITKTLPAISSDFEVIFIDDGSTDRSLAVAKALLKGRHRVKIVSLSRNYGHHQAIMKGLSYAKGDLVFLIDCDLEEPPEMLPRLYEKMRSAPKSDPIDVVHAVQNYRKGKIFERISGGLFYWLFNLLSNSKVPTNPMVARLMTRRFVKALLLHEEREFFLSGILYLAGFRQETVEVEKMSKGTTTYTFTRKLSIALKAFTSFSDRPLFFILYFGFFLSFSALVGAAFLFSTVYFFGKQYLAGWISIMLSICFFGGFSIASIGVVGLYLGRIFMEVKKRPYIVKGVHSNY